MKRFSRRKRYWERMVWEMKARNGRKSLLQKDESLRPGYRLDFVLVFSKQGSRSLDFFLQFSRFVYFRLFTKLQVSNFYSDFKESSGIWGWKAEGPSRTLQRNTKLLIHFRVFRQNIEAITLNTLSFSDEDMNINRKTSLWVLQIWGCIFCFGWAYACVEEKEIKLPRARVVVK